MNTDIEKTGLPNPEEYPLKEILDPKRTALLVVDIQNDFCDRAGYFATKLMAQIQPMEDVIPHIQELIEQAHQAGVQVIYTLGYEDVDLRDEPGKWRYSRFETLDGVEVNSKKGTWGSQFCKVKPQPGDIVIEKHDWSAFSGQSVTNFHQTQDPFEYQLGDSLDDTLRKKDIQTLVVVGVKTEVCIDDTIIEGKRKHYFMVIPQEAVGTDEIGMQEPHLRKWNFKSGLVTSKEEVMQNWPAKEPQVINPWTEN